MDKDIGEEDENQIYVVGRMRIFLFFEGISFFI